MPADGPDTHTCGNRLQAVFRLLQCHSRGFHSSAISRHITVHQSPSDTVPDPSRMEASTGRSETQRNCRGRL